MGHYYVDFMCDFCGKLYGCDCYSINQCDRLLKILEKSEDKFIQEIAKLIYIK